MDFSHNDFDETPAPIAEYSSPGKTSSIARSCSCFPPLTGGLVGSPALTISTRVVRSTPSKWPPSMSHPPHCLRSTPSAFSQSLPAQDISRRPASGKLNSNTDLILGARYTWEEQLGPRFRDNHSSPRPGHSDFRGYIGGSTSYRLGSDIPHRIGPSISDTIMAYVSFNKGFKSGGFNSTTFTAAPMHMRRKLSRRTK